MMTRNEIIATLNQYNVTFNPKAKRADLEAICPDPWTDFPVYDFTVVDTFLPAEEEVKKEATTKSKPVEVPHKLENTVFTGLYTDELEELLHVVYNAIPENIRGSFNVHADPKKKKLMIRWTGKSMLFKVFIQRKGVKVHLKREEDWAAAPFDHSAPFFQNGFNLPYAVKMSTDDFTNNFLPWIFSIV